MAADDASVLHMDEIGQKQECGQSWNTGSNNHQPELVNPQQMFDDQSKADKITDTNDTLSDRQYRYLINPVSVRLH